MTPLRKPYGFAMLPLILALFIVIGLISAGIMMLGPAVQRGKTVEAAKSLDSIANAVILWSASSRTLPLTLQRVFTGGNPQDPWGNNIQYIFDNNLTATGTGGICGRTATNLTVNGTPNIAFALLSSGGDALESSWSGAPALNPAVTAYGAIAAGTTAARVPGTPADLFKIVTLEELKNRAGCYGSTPGRLKILNNELPKGCSGAPYSATIFANGGVPFGGTNYEWSIANLPVGVTAIPSAIYPAWTAASVKLQLSGTTSFGTLTVYVRDNHSPPNVVQKSLTIATASSCGGLNFNNIANDFNEVDGSGNNITIDTITHTVNLGNNQYNGTNGYGCLWYKLNQPLAGKTFRGIFDFRTNNDTSASSTTYGDGFTLTIMQGANPTSVCGGAGEALGYGNRDGHSIPGDSFAVEFDTYPNGGENDPVNYNHVAVVKGGNVLHNGGGSVALGPNPTCTGATAASHPGCYYRSPLSWMEDSAIHKARIEITTQCNATCSSCGPATPSGSFSLIKAWLDCTNASCSDLTADYISEAPSLSHCMVLPASMNDVKIGFTEATWGATQSTIISNFIAGFF